MTYKVSVVVPVYNAEKYLKKAINSVISQTIGFDNIQLLLCDDCSTDSSYSICRQYAKKYNNVVALQTETNSGAAGAPRNLCLSKVEAPYIMFLDSDDKLLPNACELLYETIDEGNYDLVTGSYLELHYNKKVRNTRQHESATGRDYLIPDEATELRNCVIPFWTKIYRTHIIQENGLLFSNFTVSEDTVFANQYLAFCKKCRSISEPVYLYRIRNDSLSRGLSFKNLKDVIEGDEIIKDTLLANGLGDYWKHFITDHVSDYCDLLANSEILDYELFEAVTMWFPMLKEASVTGIPPKTPFAEILFDDMAHGDLEATIKHMLSLKRICSSKNQFAQEILLSRGWQLITRINQLLGK